MKVLLCFMLTILLISCGKETQTIYVRFEDAADLNYCESVVWRGKVVGRKTNLDLEPNTFMPLVTIEVDKKLRIPKDSRFEVGKSNVFENVIKIFPGKSATFLKDGETVNGYLPEDTFTKEKLFEFIREAKKAIMEEEPIDQRPRQD
jgi:ABC-type transporter Mla subunit MlaD